MPASLHALRRALTLMPVPALLCDAAGTVLQATDQALDLLDPGGIGDAVPTLADRVGPEAANRLLGAGADNPLTTITVAGPHPEAARSALTLASLPLTVDGRELLLITLQRQDNAPGHGAALEAHYRELIEALPIAVWEVDLSALKTYADQLTAEQAADLRRFFADHPEQVAEAFEKFHFLSANQAAVDLYQAGDKAELMDKAGSVDPRLSIEERIGRLAEVVSMVREGGQAISLDSALRTLSGDRRDIEMQVRVAPGHAHDYSLVFSIQQDVTSRHEVERSLRESEARLRRVIQSTPAGYCRLDPGGVVVDVNPAWLAMIGCQKREEAVGQGFDRFCFSEDAPGLERMLRNVIDHGATVSGESRRLRLDGEPGYQYHSVGPVRDKTGAIIGAEGFFIDTTARHRAEQDYRHLFAHSPGAISVCRIEVDDQGRASDVTVLEANDAYERHTGRQRSEVVDRPMSELYPREELGPILSSCQHLLEGEKTVSSVYHLPSRDRSYDASLYLVAPRRFVAVFSNITERIKTERELRETTRRLRQAQAIGRMGSWWTDARAGRLYWSDELYRIFGYQPGSLTLSREQFLDMVHEDDRTPLLEAIDQAVRDRSSYEREFRFVTRDRHVRWAFVRAYAQHDHEGVFTGFQGVLQDITDRKQLEERLRQSEKMEAIGQLAAGVAHDFNNQLTGIMGYADMLLDQEDDPARRRYLENMVLAARHATDLTQQLLAFSRKRSSKKEAVDVHQVVREVMEVFQHSVDKRIEIETRLEAADARVFANPSQFQNAVLNLALNARDAMPGGGRLCFETTQLTLVQPFARDGFEVAPGPCLRLVVRDSGHGIPAHILPRIFEPFFTTRERDAGTGMGLAAVFGTVSDMEGAVSVASTVGEGSAFEVLLPLAGSREPRRHTGHTALIRGKGARVLLVDDEEAIREMVRDMLIRLEYQVVAKENGAVGLAYYQEHWQEVDLVLLDMMMPVMSGGQMFADVMALNPEAAVLLISGYSIGDEARQLLSKGAKGFLQKPFTQAELARAVAEALAGGADAGASGGDAP